MSKIDELIQQLCPDGVEYRELGEITKWDKRFNGVGNKPVAFKHVPAAQLKSLLTNNGDIKLLSTGKFDGYTSRQLAGDNLNVGEIISIPTGGAANIKYWNGEFVDSGNILAVTENKNISLKYVYYHLLAKNELIQNYFRGSGVAHPSMPEILKIKIPIPPLEVQREIVDILDKFTQLEAELEARKKQYEHYRNQLLTFDDAGGVRWTTMSDIANFMNGKGHEKGIVDFGDYIVVNSKFVSTSGSTKKFSDEQIVPVYKGDILMVLSDLPNGKALAKTFYVDEDNKYTLNQRICSLSVKDTNEVNSKYLFYLANRNGQLLRYDNGVDQTNLRKDDILKLKIPIPPLAEQNRITDLLDKFDALVNDISTGLPAELAARRKQYEYYRSQLLTFPEKMV